ncbi:MAG: hypothetical protein JWR26_1230 [Pedosphaera sp.]|nr:hypothetical protein [Pedosphaera sp.]
MLVMKIKTKIQTIASWLRPKALTVAACVLLAMLSPGFFPVSQTARADVVRGESINASASNSVPAKAASAPESKPGPAAVDTGNGTAHSAGRKAPESAGFDRLAGFQMKVTDEMMMGTADALTTSQEIAGQIPEPIKALNEKEVLITGFMLPLMVHDGKAIEFLILKSQATCCYGTPPGLNDYVFVHMSGNGVKPVADKLVTISGILHVGESRQNRLLMGIYRMDGDKMEEPSHP